MDPEHWSHVYQIFVQTTTWTFSVSKLQQPMELWSSRNTVTGKGFGSATLENLSSGYSPDLSCWYLSMIIIILKVWGQPLSAPSHGGQGRVVEVWDYGQSAEGKPLNVYQCCGSMTFWYGSGSADPCLWLMDPESDPNPAIFIIDLQDANKK